MTCDEALDAALAADPAPRRLAHHRGAVVSMTCSACGWHLPVVWEARGAALADAHADRTGCPTPTVDE